MPRILFILLALTALLKADVKSSEGRINFDSNMDQQAEMILNQTGLGIGTLPSSNLHVQGNALITQQVSIGSNSGASNLNISGTIGFSSETIVSDSTLGNASVVLVDSSSDNIILTLPYAGNVAGRQVLIKKISSLNSVWITSANVIDDTLPLEMPESSQLASVKLISDGTQWYKLSENHLATTVAADNLLAWWKFDESSGNIAYDSSSYGRHATLTGSTNFSSGQIPAALSNGILLDGNDGEEDNITLDNPISFSSSDPWTISFWVEAQGNQFEGMIMGDTSQISYYIWLNLGNYLRINNGGNHDFTELTDFSSLSQYALTSNGVTIKLYKNGIYIAEKSTSSTLIINTLGDAHTSTSFRLQGILDDIRVYNKVLTAAEISSLYKP